MDLGPIKDIDALALDFDGTVCRLFAGYDLQATARRLREGMKRFGVNFLLSQDTFDVFAAIDRQTPPEDGARIWARLAADAVLTEAELDAVEQAAPVKGAENALLRLTLAGSTRSSRSQNTGFLYRFARDSSRSTSVLSSAFWQNSSTTALQLRMASWMASGHAPPARMSRGAYQVSMPLRSR